MKSYILNDETKANNYGFKILNKGISLERFNKNPVCLNDHINKTKCVLGKWEDLKFEEHLLIGTPVFDTRDEDGLEVIRKILAGVIKGTSLGFDFRDEDFELIDGELVLTKCELKEISFVAVPSNANTIVLFDSQGVELTKEKVNELCLSAQEKSINTEIKMKQVLQHLQLSDNSTESEVLEVIKSLEGRLTTKTTEATALKEKVVALEEQKQAQLKAEFDAELLQAVKDGRLDEQGKAPIEEMTLSSGYDKGMKLLKALPKRKNIADKLVSLSATLASFDKMNWAELDKGNHLGTLKADHPDYYKERFVKQFGTEPNE